MAQLVLGVGTSHSPQVTVPADQWHVLREKDETDPRLDFEGLKRTARPNLEPQLEPRVWQERAAAVDASVRTLGDALRAARPDVVIVFGDDQHEQFLDDNLPVLSIFHGDAFPLVHEDGRNRKAFKVIESQRWAPTDAEYPGHRPLAEHLISCLVLDEFDIARTNRLRPEVGIGHAFAFLYRRLWPGTHVPMIPVMINTYFPPNQPTPKRCYSLGQAIRRAVEAWPGPERVAVIASGGLSHTIMDEDLDRAFLTAMEARDTAALFAMPRPRLKGGTSEILNWITVCGAMEDTAPTVVNYLPGYRSLAATGCGMGFALWQPGQF
jgi:aromatic ring-opening dioxygenase catalytic subunit (LigB family)